MSQLSTGARASRARSLLVVAIAGALLTHLQPVAPARADDGSPQPQAPVELEQFTTETSQVLQLPDGTLQLTSYREPVRVERNGSWVDVDVDVERKADGSIAPVATSSDVEFSPGGTGPLVTMSAEGHEVGVQWEGVLPQPTIDGDTVTYAEVRPGVDLVLTSTPTGYTKALVIRDAAAARGLVDDPAHLSVSGNGLTFTTNADGHAVASDGSGPVFTSAPAVVWDSHETGPNASDASASDPGDSRVRRADAELTAQGQRLDLELAPPAELLADPAVEYPLYLDPVVDKSKYHYLTVHSRGWDYYDDSAQPMRVGYCGWAECNTSTQGTARSYFSFDLSALTLAGADPIVYDATVYARQIYNATSSAQPVNLTKATAFSSSTNWPGPIGSSLQTISSAAGYGSNSPATLGFSSDAVTSYVQASANAEDSKVQFALSAPDSDNRNQWKKFANNPSITVKYGYPPTTPTDLNVSSAIKCSGQPVYVPDTTPTLYARSDERSSANYGLLYYFDVYAGSTIARGNSTGVSGASNALVAWTVSPALGQGAVSYKVQAKVNDPDVPNTASGVAGPYAFTVDTVAPAVPSISSFTHPQEYWGAAQNATGTFNVAGSSDSAGFAWAIDGGVPAKPNNTTCSYTATNANGLSGYIPASAGKGALNVPANRLTSGRHTLTVMAFDHAHNASANSQTYVFYVAPTIAGSTGKNLLELENLTTTQPAGQTDVTTYNASSTAWSGGAMSSIVANDGTEQDPSTVDYHFQVPADGYYALGVRLRTAYHYAQVRFAVAEASDPYGDSRLPLLQPDKSAPLVVDTSTAASGTTYVPLGEYLPQEGVRLKPNVDYVLSVQIVGTSGTDYLYNGTFGDKTFTDFHDNGHTLGLDSLTLAPLRLADFPSLGAAFDNQGIGASTASAFALSTGSTTSLSLDALRAAGITPGQPATVGGVPFSIPATNGGKDNVISQGQSIAMPAGTKGSNVYLLAAANCGPVTAEASRQLTIGYRVEVEPGVFENATSDAPVMQVPDWLAPPAPASAGLPASVRMSSYLDGSAQVTTGTPTLYVLRFPVDANYTSEEINRITLPRVGTTYSSAACGQPGTQSLRIFAMTVQ